MLKKFLGVATALALMAPVGVIAASPAGAAPLVTCAKPSGSVSFSPGYGATPKIQTTTFSLPIKNCTGKGGVKSGTSKGKTVGKTKQSCADFASERVEPEDERHHHLEQPQQVQGRAEDGDHD